MKTDQEIRKDLEQYTGVLGFNLNEVEQGAPEWLYAKLGVISASNAARACGSKVARNTYMLELLAQVFTSEQKEIKAKPMEWGKMYEVAARAQYEFQIKGEIKEYPFMFKDTRMRVGASPDGLIHSKSAGNEIKCPYTTQVHLDLLINEKVKKDYEYQVQHSMYVTGADQWHFASYDPRMNIKPLVIKIMDRNEQFMELFRDAYHQFAYEMDKILHSQGISYGFQWSQEEYDKLQKLNVVTSDPIAPSVEF